MYPYSTLISLFIHFHCTDIIFSVIMQNAYEK